MEDFKIQLNRMEHSINKINISMEKKDLQNLKQD